jgi:RNA polymerase sigma-70 factor (ECF subfamily)
MSTHPVDDFELLRMWAAGHAASGDLLARRYYPNVRRFFDSKVPTDAEDLTQRTFLACAENIGAYRGPSVSTRTSISMIVANRQEHHLLLLAYAKLPTEQQIAIELYYWEDMNSTEIAAALDIPVSTVTTRLSRARSGLRDAVIELSLPGAVRDSLVADLERWTRSLVTR